MSKGVGKRVGERESRHARQVVKVKREKIIYHYYVFSHSLSKAVSKKIVIDCLVVASYTDFRLLLFFEVDYLFLYLFKIDYFRNNSFLRA